MIRQDQTESAPPPAIASETGPAPDEVATLIPGAEAVGGLVDDSLGGLPDWLRILIITAVIIVVLIVAQTIIWTILRRITSHASRAVLKPLVSATSRPARATAAFIGVTAGLGVCQQLGMATPLEAPNAASTLGALIALSITWLVIGVVRGADDIVLDREQTLGDDDLRARKTHTQVAVLSRTLMVVIGIFGVGIALMQFDQVARVGTSLLASAGVAGIVLGFAARPVLGNIIAGIQIALTQPIRLGDVVIIEGEWGRIEEITTTYVVMRIWDERRLIVPFSTIIEQPFENWTRHSTSLLGTIYFYADYSLPIDDVRAELKRICEGNPRWDGRVCSVLVTDANDRSIQVRALISAANASDQWDLRCEVREKLVAYVHRAHPGALPREREEEFTHPAGELGRG
ncbi:MAG: mechanosensitive ion channel domain-containing protein [Planctomycetota bacterium]